MIASEKPQILEIVRQIKVFHEKNGDFILSNTPELFNKLEKFNAMNSTGRGYFLTQLRKQDLTLKLPWAPGRFVYLVTAYKQPQDYPQMEI